jgi:hypothetical protein
MSRRLITAVVAFAMLLLGVPVGPRPVAAAGAIALTTVGTPYTQPFDTLATSGTVNTVLPTGWELAESGTSTRNNGAYAAGTGSDNAGDVYSFGALGSTERAFGTLLSGTLTPTIGASFTNNTGGPVTGLTISYVGEQWRLGASARGADRLDFQYSFDATSLTTGSWTDADALDFSSPITVGTVGALDGNAGANRTAIAATITNVAIANGASFWIRWSDFNVSSSDDGLALDEFSLTPQAADVAPSIAFTSPASGATGVAPDISVTIGFSEPVALGASWFDITCSTSGAHPASVSNGGTNVFILDPTSNFGNNETCTVTVYAAQVTDVDTDDPPNNMTGDYVFTFQTAAPFTCGDPATRIHDVQGSGTATPLAGSVVTVEGVVVGDYQQAGGFSGFYVEEEAADADADPLTSEGIFVFNTSFAVNAGDLVRLRGTATEFSGLTEIASVNALSVCSTGVSVPATAVSLPVANVTDLERYEGMLVSFDQTLTATEVFTLGRFGEVSLSGVGRLYTPTAITTPGAAAIAQLAQNNRSRIILDDGNNQPNIDPTLYPQGGLSASNTLRVGDTLGGLTGVMDFRFSNYRIQPVGPLSFVHANARTAAPAPVGGNLKIASFNVLNFFNGDGLGGGFPTPRGANTLVEFQRQLAKEVSALTAINADIVGLMELENDAPPYSAIEDLVAALNAAMGAGTYSFIDTGIIGTDAIKVALIYKPAAVTPAGGFQIITSGTDPRFIDTLNRPSLAQTFHHSATGQKLTVVVNHLKSKGSDCAFVGDPDTGDGQGNCNLTRTAAAAALADWLAGDPTGSGDPDVLLIGDLNSYTFEDPVTTLTSGGFTNLVRTFGGLAAYSYVFNGESGYLDHGLATLSLAAQVTGATDWHINPDEPVALDYNLEFKTLNQQTTFYDPGPYRSSDHDPVVIGLHFNTPPTANAGGPYSGVPFDPVTFAGSATDPDGALATLTYVWDFDYDGTFTADATGADLRNPTHAYASTGTYTVALRVTDTAGDSSPIATATVTIALPTATEGKIQGTLTWGDVIKTKLNVDSKNGAIKGSITFEGDGRTYESTRFDSMVATGTDATVYGAFGSVMFRLDVHDGGPQGADTLRLRTTDGYDSGVLTQPRGELLVLVK